MDFKLTTVKIENVIKYNTEDTEVFDSEALQYNLYKAINKLNNGPFIVDYSNLVIQTKRKGNMVGFRLTAPGLVLIEDNELEEDEEF